MPVLLGIFVTVGPFPVEDNVVSCVKKLSLVDDCDVIVLIGVTAVVNVDCAVVVDSDSVVEVN